MQFSTKRAGDQPDLEGYVAHSHSSRTRPNLEPIPADWNADLR
jgi:hypothetical protein